MAEPNFWVANASWLAPLGGAAMAALAWAKELLIFAKFLLRHKREVHIEDTRDQTAKLTADMALRELVDDQVKDLLDRNRVDAKDLREQLRDARQETRDARVETEIVERVARAWYAKCISVQRAAIASGAPAVDLPDLYLIPIPGIVQPKVGPG